MRVRLSEWLACERAGAAALDAADASLPAAIQTSIRPALNALAGDERFLRALAVASPTLFAQWTRHDRRAIERLTATKLERSLLLYLARACAKTSPFSVFMHQAIVGTETASGALPTVDPEDRDSQVSVDRGFLFERYQGVLRSAAGTPSPSARSGGFTVNPSAAWRDDGGVELLAPRDVRFSTRVLRLGEWKRFRFHPLVAAALVRLPSRFSAFELRQALLDAGIRPAAVAAFAEQLRDRGVVDAASHTSGFDARPDFSYLAALEQCGTLDADDACDELAQLVDAVRTLPAASSRERRDILERARVRVDTARGASEAPPRESERTLFWEDGFFREPLESAGDGLVGLLQELAVSLRASAVVTAPYRLLTEYFIEEHGAGGRCHDVVRFLSRASEALNGSRWWLSDPTIIERPAGEDARVATTALVQVCAADEAALAAGNATLVVNHTLPGCGALSARHAFGSTAYHQRLRRSLKEWLVRIHAPAEPVDVMISGACNTLQAHPRLTRRALEWPVEPDEAASDERVPLADVTLCHNPISGLFEIVDANGRALAPVYLGTTVPHPAWGPEFWMTTIASPYRIARPLEELRPPLESDPEVVSLPRRSEGRIVHARASWWMKSARLRRLWYGGADARRLFNVATDCRALGIPRRFFVRPAPTAGLRIDDRKPIWIDARNPFCLDVLWFVVARTEWLLLTEASPDVPVWPRLHERAHVSELSVEMVV